MRRAIAFFDRDGTLIEDQAYHFDPSTMRWNPGALQALRTTRSAGYLVGVVTNQSAVAQGLCSDSDVKTLHAEMAAQARAEGALIHFFDYCPFHANANITRYRFADHPDRKPNPGMILRALAAYDADLGTSFLIGDKSSDVAAAYAAGIRGALYRPGASLSEIVDALLEQSRVVCE